jgi:hypothetical protein
MHRTITFLGIGILLSIGGMHESSSKPRVVTTSVDQVVKSPYTTDAKTRIEVLAIASIEGDTVKCWSPDGTQNPSMATAVHRSIEQDRSGLSSQFTSVQGKKNRVVIFKVTYHNYSNSVDAVDLISLGDTHASQKFPLFILQMVTKPYPPGYSTQYLARSIAVDEHEAKTNAVLALTSTNKSFTLPFKVGATCQANGRTAKITQIEPYTQSKIDPSLKVFFEKGKTWHVQIKCSHADRKGYFEFAVNYKNGQHRIWVDRDGHPVSRAEVNRILAAETGLSNIEKEKSRPIASEAFLDQARDHKPLDVGYSVKNYLFNIDPKDLPLLRVTPKSIRVLEMRDIPLF